MLSGPVLTRSPGDEDWSLQTYNYDSSKGFELPEIQKMAGGSMFTFLQLSRDFALICDERGTLKDLDPCIAIRMGTFLQPLVGPVAIVRAGTTRFMPLRDGDADRIRTEFE